MYLVEALKYNVQAFHEDRLTQIVAATFNESKFFQKIFLNFLKVPYVLNLSAKTQVANEAAPSRPDIILYNSEIPYLLIESKIGLASNRDQQHQHIKLKATYNFLFVRDPVPENRKSKKFNKVTWYDFFTFLVKIKDLEMKPTDAFLIEKLVNYGKACKMLMPDKIEKADFENASKFFTQIRLRENPNCLFEMRTPFQSLDTISLFLERALIKVKDDPVVGVKISPFRKRLGISCIYHEPIKLKISRVKSIETRRELSLKTESIIIDKEIKLKKSIGGFYHLYVRAIFEPILKDKEVIDLKFEEILKVNMRDLKYRCRIVGGLTNMERTFFDTIVFEDTSDLEFGNFYRLVIKSWERKMKI